MAINKTYAEDVDLTTKLILGLFEKEIIWSKTKNVDLTKLNRINLIE